MRQDGRLLAQLNSRVIDLDDSKPVPAVIWVDVEAGLLEAYQTDAFGRIRKDPRDGGLLTYTARGRFKVVPVSQLPPPPPPKKKLAGGAPKCARCSSVLTLPGSDLCPSCNARDKNYRNKFLVERVVNPLGARPCAHKGCIRPAAFGVGDDVAVSPAVGPAQGLFGAGPGVGKVLYERGATVGRRWYCHFHFRPPRVLDARGEVVEVIDESHGVRPQ